MQLMRKYSLYLLISLVKFRCVAEDTTRWETRADRFYILRTSWLELRGLFSAHAQVFDRKTMLLLRTFVDPVTKAVGSPLLKTAASEFANLVSGRKKLKGGREFLRASVSKTSF